MSRPATNTPSQAATPGGKWRRWAPTGGDNLPGGAAFNERQSGEAILDITGQSSNIFGKLPAEVAGYTDEFEKRVWQIQAAYKLRAKRKAANGGYFSFLLCAGVGSGKTKWAAIVASEMFNHRPNGRPFVEGMVYVVPSLSLCQAAIDEFKRANIHLTAWDRSRCAGPGCLDDGFVITYQALMGRKNRDAIAALCKRRRMLVVFDEIHHLGDKLEWGDAARSAVEGRASCVLGMTGTPYRIDNRKIPFVEYEMVDGRPDGLYQYKADFTYTLGRSIVDGHTSKPVFHWSSATVHMRGPDDEWGDFEFADSDGRPIVLDPILMNRRLKGAVMAGSSSRAKILARTINDCRRLNLRLIIFVGGDSRRKNGGGVHDATILLPKELRDLGVSDEEICVVVGTDSLAGEKLARFEKSKAWVLISVNKVSEGVDIPSLSAALFLTSITARATTIQRIGRIVRGQGECHVYMFEDPRYIEIAEHIETEWKHEIDLGKVATKAASNGEGGEASGGPLAFGIDSQPRGITVGGTSYSPACLAKYWQVLRDRGYPEGYAFMSVLLPLIAEGKYGPIEVGGDQ